VGSSVPGGGGGEGRALCGWLLVLLLSVAALGVRLASIDFALPYFKESDAHVYRQIHLLGLEELTPELWKQSSIYPHLMARTVLAFPDPLAAPPDPDAMTLEEHLDFAGGLDRLVRGIVSVASVLLIPATWLLARRLFTPGWSLFAAALCSLSLLNLQFGQLARPHAFAAPFTVLAVAAAVRLRRRPDLPDRTDQIGGLRDCRLSGEPGRARRWDDAGVCRPRAVCGRRHGARIGFPRLGCVRL
jgi:hypothetical protein